MAVGIRGTAGAVGTPGAVGVTGRIGIIRVRAQLAVIVPLLVIEPRRVGGERIRRRLIAEGTAIGTEGIVQAVRLEGAAGSERIGRGFRVERIGAQLAEIFRVDGERQWQQHEQKEDENTHGEPPSSGRTSGFSLLPA